MIPIPLTNRPDEFALVDLCDFEAVMAHEWYFTAGYVHATDSTVGSLHRFVAGRMGIDGQTIDHINRSGLDNTRANLRAATVAQNGWNAVRKLGASGFPGVHRNRSAWAVRFDFMGAPVYFGTHRDLAVARRIAAMAILKLKGEFLPAETLALLQKEVQP